MSPSQKPDGGPVLERSHSPARAVMKSAQTGLSEGSAAPPTVGRSLAICAMYGTTSISITFFNKAVFHVYAFKFPCIVTLLQLLVCITILSVAHVAGFIQLPRFNAKTTRQVFPLTTVWWLYVVSGIAALRYLTIPMFSTLRKSTAMIVLILEASILRKHARPSVWAAISIMVLGGFIAGATDLAYSQIGYVLVGVCCVTTALYLVLIVSVSRSTQLGTFSLLFYNNVLSLPLMTGYLLLFTDELKRLPHYPHLYDPKFIAFLLFSAAQATVLNIAIFLCTKLNSPLATTVTGQVKDFVTIGVGLFVFGDVKLSVPNLFGLGVSMAGSLMYSLIKLFAARAKTDTLGSK